MLTNNTRIKRIKKSEDLGRVKQNGGVTYLGADEVLSLSLSLSRTQEEL
jgi:hypothetical protein